MWVMASAEERGLEAFNEAKRAAITEARKQFKDYYQTIRFAFNNLNLQENP
jgi:hypothetical protein